MSTGSTTSAFVVKPLPLCHQTPIMPRRSLQGKATPAAFGHARQKFETSLLSPGALPPQGTETTWHAFLPANKLGHDGRAVASARGAWPKGNLPAREPSASSHWRSRARAPHGHAKGFASRPLQVAVRHTHTHHVRSPAAEVAAALCRSDGIFPRSLLVRYSALTAAADVPGA